jgi:GT2 family glycosyltransferase
MVDVIMVTYNRLQFTKQAIQSLKRTACPYRLIVVDNNSNDGTQDYLNQLKNKGKIDTLIFNDVNLGLEKALNKGLQKVQSTSYFITTDNDCIACQDWLEKLIFLMETHQEYAAISCRPQILIGVGPIFKTNKEVVENNVVGGSVRIMDTLKVKGVGGWTDKFEKDGRGNEEHDICGKLRADGWKVGFAKDVWTYHLFGKDRSWGYNLKSNYKMGRVLDKSPDDIEYNLITCEPKHKSNE